MDPRDAIMGGISASGSLSAVFGALLLLSVPSGGEGFVWDRDFGGLLEIPPIQTSGVAVGPEPAPAANLSDGADGGRVPTSELSAAIEALFTASGRPEGGADGRTEAPGFSFVLPPGWTATPRGDQDGGNLTLEGGCSLATVGWFEDPGIDPEVLLRQVGRAYRSDALRFSVLEVEPGRPIVVDGQRASALNVFYMYGGRDSQKRIVAWPSPRSGRFFFASFWSCTEGWEENLGAFEAFLESFRDEGSEGYVELEPRNATFDGWGSVLSETLRSHHFEGVEAAPTPEVEVKVTLTAHRVADRVDHLASEEIVSSTRAALPAREAALESLLLDRGYQAAVLRGGGSFWVVVLGPEGGWQAISSSGAGGRGVGSLVGPEDLGWYRGLVVALPEAVERSEALVVQDCDPPRLLRLDPRAEVNLTWILGLEGLLDRYSYSSDGADPGSFAKAQVCWALLEREGHDALLMRGCEGHPLHPRMWVIVRHPGSGHVAVDPGAAGDRGLGEIVSGEEWFDGVGYETSLQYSCLHPGEGLAIDPGAVKTPAP